MKTRRIFIFNGSQMRDPAPDLDIAQVKGILAASYPELNNATLTLKDSKEENGAKTETWEFVKKVGTKG